MANNDSPNSEIATACMKGNAEAVKKILNEQTNAAEFHKTAVKYTDPDGEELTKPPLFIAVDYGHMELVKIFLDAKVDVDLKDDSGYTPLQWSAWQGRLEMVKLFLEHGAKVDQEALDLGKESGNEDVINLLFKHVDLYKGITDDDEVMVKACREGDVEKVKTMMEGGYDYSKWKDEEGNYQQYSPMFLAVKYGHMEVVQALMEAGVEIDMKEEGL